MTRSRRQSRYAAMAAAAAKSQRRAAPRPGLGDLLRGRVPLRRVLRRGPWENGACGLIALGVFMLMQPFSLWLYSHSFVVILAGTLGFVVVSHFPEGADG